MGCLYYGTRLPPPTSLTKGQGKGIRGTRMARTCPKEMGDNVNITTSYMVRSRGSHIRYPTCVGPFFASSYMVCQQNLQHQTKQDA